jgi:NAD(P)-dependent dehydrogenase (short-subunit alcohol dehydrogenase family)
MDRQTSQPGDEYSMQPCPLYIREPYDGGHRLHGKVALITGGDSGIGRAVAVHFAAEGASGVVISYLNEERDARHTMALVEERGSRCCLLRGDVRDAKLADNQVAATVEEFGQLDVLVNNAAQQFPRDDVTDIDDEQFLQTFDVNVFGYFRFARAAIPHLRAGGSIINTSSVTAYRGSDHLVDYAASKGAVTALTRALANNLVGRGIRVNGVAPGPVWTPLIVSTFDSDDIEKFGRNTPMGRAGQPSEIAPCYVFLASDDATYITGQVLHPNGGEIVGG